MKRKLEYFYGCLVGGAIGDALGAPVEFMKYDKIQEIYGDDGVKEFTFSAADNKACITDDTQMTLFTAEGLLRNVSRTKQKNIGKNERDTTILIFRAYLRWLYTQGLKMPNWGKKSYDGWLINVKALHAYKEPGVTCITSLGKGIMGTELIPINDSLGCGGVTRVTPIGLFEEEAVFDIGAHSAAITHGHPTAYLAAGCMATIIHNIIQGDDLEVAILKAIAELKSRPRHEECAKLLERAVLLAKEGEPSRDKIQGLGSGFLAHESVAIAIYAALSYPDNFEKGIIFAVNHDGNSDGTGALTGSILGAYLGIDAIDKKFVENVELSQEILEIAKDLLIGHEESEAWYKKYPAW